MGDHRDRAHRLVPRARRERQGRLGGARRSRPRSPKPAAARPSATSWSTTTSAAAPSSAAPGAASGRAHAQALGRLALRREPGRPSSARARCRASSAGTDFGTNLTVVCPWSDRRLSPQFAVGLGKFQNIPSSLVDAGHFQRQTGRRPWWACAGTFSDRGSPVRTTRSTPLSCPTSAALEYRASRPWPRLLLLGMPETIPMRSLIALWPGGPGRAGAAWRRAPPPKAGEPVIVPQIGPPRREGHRCRTTTSPWACSPAASTPGQLRPSGVKGVRPGLPHHRGFLRRRRLGRPRQGHDAVPPDLRWPASSLRRPRDHLLRRLAGLEPDARRGVLRYSNTRRRPLPLHRRRTGTTKFFNQKRQTLNFGFGLRSSSSTGSRSRPTCATCYSLDLLGKRQNTHNPRSPLGSHLLLLTPARHGHEPSPPSPHG